MATITVAAPSVAHADARRADWIVAHYLKEIRLEQYVAGQPGDDDEVEACFFKRTPAIATCAKHYEVPSSVLRYVRAHAKYFKMGGNIQVGSGYRLEVSDARQRELEHHVPDHPAIKLMEARRSLLTQRMILQGNRHMDLSDENRRRTGKPFQGAIVRDPSVTESSVRKARDRYLLALDHYIEDETDKTVKRLLEEEKAIW